MSVEVTLQERGQITVPKTVREQVKAKRGDRFTVDVNDDGQIVMTPKRHLTIYDLQRMFPITGPVGDFEENMREAERKLAEEFR